MNGLHILAEFHDCAGEPRLLRDADTLAALCRRVCVEAGLEVVAAAFHQFPEAGATGALVLAESHLAVHTWPEQNAVTCDLYVCNHSRDNRAAAESAYRALALAFQPGRSLRRDIERGTPGAVAPVSGNR
ncbi:MAG: adenosylmethionine decarboxylase [Rhodocyclales bacterium]|nr:adenosylmethionine decarboxylase [Rhodocyclales bacterium]